MAGLISAFCAPGIGKGSQGPRAFYSAAGRERHREGAGLDGLGDVAALAVAVVSPGEDLASLGEGKGVHLPREMRPR